MYSSIIPEGRVEPELTLGSIQGFAWLPAGRAPGAPAGRGGPSSCSNMTTRSLLRRHYTNALKT